MMPAHRKFKGSPCKVDDCDKPATCRYLCHVYYTRLRRHGDPQTKKKTGIPTGTLSGPAHFNRKPVVGYLAAHDRIRAARGKASAYPCVDCGDRATDWSYDGDDPAELLDDTFPHAPMAYSLDLGHYDPRCKPCHGAFDGERRRNRTKVTA